MGLEAVSYHFLLWVGTLSSEDNHGEGIVYLYTRSRTFAAWLEKPSV